MEAPKKTNGRAPSHRLTATDAKFALAKRHFQFPHALQEGSLATGGR
jgi:hypothetical protein